MIRTADLSDIDTVARLAHCLWPYASVGELKEEMKGFLTGDESVIFLYFDGDEADGFAQCQLRHDYVNGSTTNPVGYLEGIYVEPRARRRGVARELLSRCEAWARERGCTEFGSDVELQNTISQSFHEHVGFSEDNRIVCYIKPI